MVHNRYSVDVFREKEKLIHLTFAVSIRGHCSMMKLIFHPILALLRSAKFSAGNGSYPIGSSTVMTSFPVAVDRQGIPSRHP